MSEDRQSGHSRSRRALRAERAPEPDDGQQNSAPLVSAAAQQSSSGHRPGRRRAADAPVDAEPTQSGERQSLARARDREALRAYKALAEQEQRKPQQQPLTRRQLRQQQLDAERRAAGLSTSRQPIVEPATTGSGESDSGAGSGQQETSGAEGTDAGQQPQPEDDASLNNLSVEEALAARSALVEQAKNQMAMLEVSQEQQDPESVDLEVLAEQKKLAERAAILNQRAMAKQRLSEENQRGKAQQNDPASAHNLAMVTPLEFVKIPGQELPVMKPPTTSHIPVITSNNQQVPPVPEGTKVPPPPVTQPRFGQADPDTAAQEQDDPPSMGGTDTKSARSRMLARAEAVASAPAYVADPVRSSRAERPAESSGESGPISAHTAHGLEPLDAMTAGMGRANKMRTMEVLIVALGAIAIVVGFIMILGG